MKTRRILATILTVLLFLSGGFLLSCSACQENTLPPNLKSYQELLDQYKPSDADLEKSLSDFSADAYGAYRRAYYQLLLCDRYSIDISGATETFGVTVEIDNLKKRDGTHFYMRTISTGSSGLLGGMTNNDVETYIDIENGYVKTQNNRKNDGYNGLEQPLDDYLSRWGVLQYALCNYVIDETTVENASMEMKDGHAYISFALDPVPATVNHVKQTKMLSGTSADYEGGSITYTVEIDASFAVRSINVRESYKAMGFQCQSEITDVYSYEGESGFVPMEESESYTYSGDGTGTPVVPVYDATYLLNALAPLGAGTDAKATVTYGDFTLDLALSFSLDPLAVKVETELSGIPLQLFVCEREGKYDLFVTADELTLYGEAESLASSLSSLAAALGAELPDVDLSGMLEDFQLTALKKLMLLTGTETDTGVVYNIALSELFSGATGELTAEIGADGALKELSLAGLTAGDGELSLRVGEFAAVSDLTPPDRAEAVAADQLIGKAAEFLSAGALTANGSVMGLEGKIALSFGEQPGARLDFVYESIPVTVWLADRAYVKAGDIAVSVTYEEIGDLLRLFGISVSLPSFGAFDLSSLSLKNEGNLITVGLGDLLVEADVGKGAVSVPAYGVSLTEIAAGGDAAVPSLDWQKAGDVIPVVQSVLSYLEAGRFSFAAEAELGGYAFAARGGLSFGEDGVAVSAVAEAFGETFDLTYTDNYVYIGWAGIRAALRADLFSGLLPELPGDFAVDLSQLESVVFEENAIRIVFAGTELSVSLAGEALEIRLPGLNLTLSPAAFEAIAAPEGYADLTEAVTGLNAESLLAIMEAGAVSFTAGLGDFTAEITAAFSPLAVKAEFAVSGMPVTVYYENGTVYAEVAGYAFSLLPEDLAGLLADFGITLEGIEIDLGELLGSVRIVSAEGTSVTAEILGIPVTVDTASLDITLAGLLEITGVKAGAPQELPDRNFVYIGKSLSLIAPALEIYGAGGTTVEGSLTVGGEEIAVEAEISFADGVKAKGSMVISGITVGFVYTEGRVYLSVGELRGSLSAAELMKALGLDGLEIDILSLLGELTAGEDWLGVEVLGVPVTVRKTETGLSVTAEGLCTFSAVAGCESIAAPEGYADLTEAILSLDLGTLMNVASEGRIQLEAAVMGYAADVTIAFEPFAVKVKTEIGGVPIEAYYEDGAVWLCAGNLALYFTEEEVLSVLTEALGFDLSAVTQLPPSLILLLVGGLEADGPEVSVDALGYRISLNTASLTLTVADLATVSVVGTGEAVKRPAADYQPGAKLFVLIEELKELAEGGNLSLSGEFTFGGAAVTVDRLDLAFDETGVLFAEGTVGFSGYTAAFTYVGGRFYVDVEGIRVSAGLGYVRAMLKNAGLEMNFDLDASEILALIDGLKIGDGTLSCTVAGIPVELTFGAGISVVAAGFGELTVTPGAAKKPLTPVGYQSADLFLMQLNVNRLASVLQESAIRMNVSLAGYQGVLAVDFEAGKGKLSLAAEAAPVELFYEDGRIYLLSDQIALSGTVRTWLDRLGISLGGDVALSDFRVYFEGSTLCVKWGDIAVKVDANSLAVSVPALGLKAGGYAPAEAWTLPSADWQELDYLLSAVDRMEEIAAAGTVSLSGAFSYGELSAVVNDLTLFWDDAGITAANLSAALNGVSLSVVYTDGCFYIDYDGLKLSASAESLSALLRSLLASADLPEISLDPFQLIAGIRQIAIGKNEASLAADFGGGTHRISLSYGETLALSVNDAFSLRVEPGKNAALPAPLPGCADLSEALMQFDVSLLSLLSGECAAALSGTAAGQEISAQIALAPAAGAMSASVSVGGAALDVWLQEGTLYLAAGGAKSSLSLSQLAEYAAVFAGDWDFFAALKNSLRADGAVLSFSFLGAEISVDVAAVSVSVRADGVELELGGLAAGRCLPPEAGDYRSLDGLTPLFAALLEGYRANRLTASGNIRLGGQEIVFSDVRAALENPAGSDACGWTDAAAAFDAERLPLSGKLSFPTEGKTHTLDVTYVSGMLYVSYTDDGKNFTSLKFSRASMDAAVKTITANWSDLLSVLEILGLKTDGVSSAPSAEDPVAGAIGSLRALYAEDNGIVVGVDGAFLGLTGEYRLSVRLNADGTIGISLDGEQYGGAITLDCAKDVAIAAPSGSYIDGSQLMELVDSLIFTVNKASRQFYFEGTVSMSFLTVDVTVKLTASMRVTEDNRLDAYVTWDSARPVGEEITTIFSKPTGLTYSVHTDILAFGKSTLIYTYDAAAQDSVVLVSRMNQWADYYETGRLIKVKHYFYADGDYAYKKAYVSDIASGRVNVLDIISEFTGLKRSLLESESTSDTSYASIFSDYSYGSGGHTLTLNLSALTGTTLLGEGTTVTLKSDENGYLKDTYVSLPIKLGILEMTTITLNASHIVDREVNDTMDAAIAAGKNQSYSSFPAAA